MERATFDQAFRLLLLAKQKGRTHDWLQDLYDSGILSDVFDIPDPKKVNRLEVQRAFGLKPLTLELTTQVYPVTVDYGLSLADMIAAGKYDWVNSDITAEHFPVKGEGKVEVEAYLIHFDRVMESDDVIRELDKVGLRPAKIEELLAFGAKYPEVQREFPIPALGSVWLGRFGNRNVPNLWSNSGERNLNLNRLENRWNEHYRFLAARNSLHSLPALAGGVSFCTPLVQPPSILPISFSGSESAIYFLLSSAFSSQAT